MERKDFFAKLAVGGSALFIVPGFLQSCASDNPVNEDPGENGIEIDLESVEYAALASVGGFVYVNNIIIFRTENETYLALSKVCTHSQCTVTYHHGNGNIPCPCHGSIFSTSGAVLNGPAATNLTKYTVTKVDNKLIIT